MTRQTRFRVVCDGCGRESDWASYDLARPKGWVTYPEKCGRFEYPDDYCSPECMTKGIQRTVARVFARAQA